MARYKQKYRNEVVPALKEEFGYGNVHQIPKIQKIVVNTGIGKATQNSKILETAEEDLRRITGQQPVVRRAKKSISNFKLREGMPIGMSVTLRGDRMYDFIDRLTVVTLPRVRDFRGISFNSFDGNGNYSMGLSEQIVFPEIDLDKTEINGLAITVVTTAKSDKECEFLLKKMGFPFRKRQQEESQKAA